MPDAQRLTATIRGGVQGVGFRWAVRMRAQELGLSGYARNEADGSVRVEAEGGPDKLAELEKFLREGPRWATVEAVEATRGEATGEFSGFGTK
jgi:acylphosphatase